MALFDEYVGRLAALRQDSLRISYALELIGTLLCAALCPLCLCGVNRKTATTEAQRTQRLHSEIKIVPTLLAKSLEVDA